MICLTLSLIDGKTLCSALGSMSDEEVEEEEEEEEDKDERATMSFELLLLSSCTL